MGSTMIAHRDAQCLGREYWEEGWLVLVAMGGLDPVAASQRAAAKTHSVLEDLPSILLDNVWDSHGRNSLPLLVRTVPSCRPT